MDSNQLRLAIKVILTDLEVTTGIPCSDSAIELLMLTAAVETNCGEYIFQIGEGPARGIFQMEPATEKDIWENYIRYKDYRLALYNKYTNSLLAYHLDYAIVMTRIHYLRVKEPLPEADDIDGLANYWKEYYNTSAGKGTRAEARRKYLKYASYLASKSF